MLQGSSSASASGLNAGQSFYCDECKRQITREGRSKHDVLFHSRKTRVLRCHVCGHCEVWYDDFAKHFRANHPKETLYSGKHYYIEGLPEFKSLLTCKYCYFRHYKQEVLDKHTATHSERAPGGAPGRRIVNTTRVPAKPSPAQAAPRKLPPDSFAKIVRGVFNKTPVRTVDHSESICAADDYLVSLRKDIGEKMRDISNLKAEIQARSGDTVQDYGLGHEVVALVMIKTANTVVPTAPDLCATLYCAAILPRGRYKVYTDDVTIGEALVEPHIRVNGNDGVNPEETLIRKGFQAVGQLFSVKGPWLLCSKVFLTDLLLDRRMVFRQENSGVAIVVSSRIGDLVWNIKSL